MLTAHYNLHLVALSVVVAIFAAYAALDLGGRVAVARGPRRCCWLTGGALVCCI